VVKEGQTMQLTPEDQEAIRRIVETLKCGRDPPCHTYGFANLGHVKPIGGGVIQCLEKRGRSCPHGLSFGNSILCMCPLRKYLADHDWD
jgi:hypothetical protein